MFKEITKDNWLLFAQHHYDKPILNSEQEFYDDLKKDQNPEEVAVQTTTGSVESDLKNVLENEE